MHLVPSSDATPPAVSLSALLTLYLEGHISEAAWEQMAWALDAEGVEPGERAAMVAFFSEAFAELEPTDVKLPKQDEVHAIIHDLRALSHAA